MTYTIWRVAPDGIDFQLKTLGKTSNKSLAMEKARKYNEKLYLSNPNEEDRFVVRDQTGREIKISA